METGRPEISIVIAAYNKEDYIGACLKSVLNQSFQNYEIILVDDSSTDRTLEIANELAEKNLKIKTVTLKQNEGCSGALNKGIKHARGKYIVFLGADDLMGKDRLEKQIRFLEKNEKMVALT